MEIESDRFRRVRGPPRTAYGGLKTHPTFHPHIWRFFLVTLPICAPTFHKPMRFIKPPRRVVLLKCPKLQRGLRGPNRRQKLGPHALAPVRRGYIKLVQAPITKSRKAEDGRPFARNQKRFLGKYYVCEKPQVFLGRVDIRQPRHSRLPRRAMDFCDCAEIGIDRLANLDLHFYR